MTDDALKTLSDFATDAHTQLQQGDSGINPVIGLRRGLRDGGFPADVITIDCLQNKKRIVLILHDQHPGQLIYQFATMEDEDTAGFQQLAFDQVNPALLLKWMLDYFGASDA